MKSWPNIMPGDRIWVRTASGYETTGFFKSNTQGRITLDSDEDEDPATRKTIVVEMDYVEVVRQL